MQIVGMIFQTRSRMDEKSTKNS
ncbi:hypothetical protein [Anaerobutyricum hallii]